MGDFEVIKCYVSDERGIELVVWMIRVLCECEDVYRGGRVRGDDEGKATGKVSRGVFVRGGCCVVVEIVGVYWLGVEMVEEYWGVVVWDGV